MSSIILLGPQRHAPIVATALDSLGPEGPVCAVTAGWQEREAEVTELAAHLDREVTDLKLYHRTETLFQRDPELATAYRSRQHRLQDSQRLYRLRLAHTLAAARELLETEGPDLELLETERTAALRAVRSLDRHHLRQIRQIHTEFDKTWNPSERPALQEQREELSKLIKARQALLIAGGHVGVLIGRLRLFALDQLLNDLPIVAWSAGAMALAESIVLFHDHPPQGPGDPEVLDQGLGLVSGLVPLPHAQERLRLADPKRVALFAGRFAPARCLALDRGVMLHFRDGLLAHVQHALHLTKQGQVTEMESL